MNPKRPTNLLQTTTSTNPHSDKQINQSFPIISNHNFNDPQIQYLLMLALQQNTEAINALIQMFGPQQFNVLMNAYLHQSRVAVAGSPSINQNNTNSTFHSDNFGNMFSVTPTAQLHQQMMNHQYQQAAIIAAATAAAASAQQYHTTPTGLMFLPGSTLGAPLTETFHVPPLHSVSKQSKGSGNVDSSKDGNNDNNNNSYGNQQTSPSGYVNQISKDNSDCMASSSTVMNQTSNTSSSLSSHRSTHHTNIPPPQANHNLSKDERQRLFTEATDLTRQLLRIHAILDIDTLVLTCDLQKGIVLDRKSNCAELLVAANDMMEIEKEMNPIQLASDIFNGKRTIFPRQETLLNNGNVIDPYKNIPTKHDVPRGDLIREIATMYTALYRKSPSNQLLSIKDATIGQVEDVMRNYYKDGYKLSPGILAYLQSTISETKALLGNICGESSLRSLQPICWDVSNVPYCIKSAVYKITDRRSSAEAKQRAKDLTIRRKQMRELGETTNVIDHKQEESNQMGELRIGKKRQRLMVNTSSSTTIDNDDDDDDSNEST